MVFNRSPGFLYLSSMTGLEKPNRWVNALESLGVRYTVLLIYALILGGAGVIRMRAVLVIDLYCCALSAALLA